MTDSDDVLAANLEFYRAFGTRDVAAMEAIWARHAPVTCIHPGWTPIVEREAIVESWRQILSNPEAPEITCYDEQAFLYGAMAFVVCEEHLPGATLIASNAFIREDGVWRLVHHQASQIIIRRAEQRRPPPSRQVH